MLKFIGCMMQLIISPGKGWADVDEVGESPQQLATSGFYPLLGITACSAFLPRIYDKNLTLPVLVESAVVTFVSYFIAYFLASALMSATIGKVSTDNPGDKKINTFILYNLSILALITLIRNCLPMELSLVQFMPLFVLVIMCGPATIPQRCGRKHPIVSAALRAVYPPASLRGRLYL